MDTFNFSEHVRPVANGVVVIPIKHYEAGDVTGSGLIVGSKMPSSTPESDPSVDLNTEGDSLGLRVIAIGPDVTRVKEGDIVMVFPSTSYVNMDLFGNSYYYLMDYNIMATLSAEADELNKRLTKEKAVRAEKGRIDYRAKLLGLNGDDIGSTLN